MYFIKTKKLLIIYLINIFFNLGEIELPLVHFPSFSNTVPSGQTQATDLLGSESMTRQR
jgi:hypothetical protein